MKIQGFVTRTGANKKIGQNGKEMFFPWIILEGMFLSVGFGVNAPDQNREISATVNVSSYKVDPNKGADATKGARAPSAPEGKAKYQNNYTIVGWSYLAAQPVLA